MENLQNQENKFTVMLYEDRLRMERIEVMLKAVCDNYVTETKMRLNAQELMLKHEKSKHKALDWQTIATLLAMAIMVGSALFSKFG